jgi:hypothetical protein
MTVDFTWNSSLQENEYTGDVTILGAKSKPLAFPAVSIAGFRKFLAQPYAACTVVE